VGAVEITEVRWQRDVRRIALQIGGDRHDDVAACVITEINHRKLRMARREFAQHAKRIVRAAVPFQKPQ